MKNDHEVLVYRILPSKQALRALFLVQVRQCFESFWKFLITNYLKLLIVVMYSAGQLLKNIE